MRTSLITTRVHSVIDYVAGVALIAAPWLFGFSANMMATYCAVGVGLFLIVQNLFTAWEYSLAKVIPASTHVVLDYFAGAFLAFSPWLLGYAEVIYLPHLFVGLYIIGQAIVSSTVPYADLDTLDRRERMYHDRMSRI